MSDGVSPTTRKIAAIVASVVALAAVILAVAALSAPKSQGPSRQEPTSQERSDLALTKGRTALASGQTTQAISLLEEAVRLDPGNDEAAQALADAKKKRQEPNPQNDDAASGEATPALTPDDPVMLTDVDDLAALLPGEAQGFTLGSSTGMGDDWTVAGTATRAGTAVPHVQWTVHDRKTPQGAAQFVESTSRALYAADTAAVIVDGASAHFGTDGKRFASVVYIRGRYVFETVLTVTSGAPKAHRAEAERAARAFPEQL